MKSARPPEFQQQPVSLSQQCWRLIFQLGNACRSFRKGCSSGEKGVRRQLVSALLLPVLLMGQIGFPVLPGRDAEEPCSSSSPFLRATPAAGSSTIQSRCCCAGREKGACCGCCRLKKNSPRSCCRDSRKSHSVRSAGERENTPSARRKPLKRLPGNRLAVLSCPCGKAGGAVLIHCGEPRLILSSLPREGNHPLAATAFFDRLSFENPAFDPETPPPQAMHVACHG